METLPTIWFILIAVLWAGYLFLEGFDLGVGMLMKLFARENRERRVLLNTVGPVWDGNEVWLITAVGAMFAAFPRWYAALLSALYLPMILVLLGLIFRAVGFEYRGKVNSERWRSGWDWAIFGGSLISAFGVGTALVLTSTGLPLNANGDRVGGAFAWFNGYTLLGGAAVVLFCLIQALAFLALKTDGLLRARARRLFARWAPVALLPLLLWAVLVGVGGAKLIGWLAIAVAVLTAVAAVLAARRGREGWSFISLGVFLLAVVGSIFYNLYPRVLPSSLSASFDLTIQNASSSAYTLGLMSVIACFGVPLVLAYQGWTYWVFRKRISPASIPA
ncbi:cytochrome d ubiquinol oxidase subunit II [Psychromicrobium lacuslunae]|uniref:Cytochrome C oxidase assembly protein n=1 Tax=Psychromicrobium lacuslunae TaxID=1618207 RepID=A0A0D4BWD5_9MICC|nr:cytochrome d ubiquinol oxidase subunit II [Psychromicrobium lacuslunae]AJT40767.1 cytochrome C oxidase assembly protein [Psychromicrobium lacuslunae]